MKIEGAHVAVVGMARSGVAAVELLLEKGAHVVAVDQQPKPNPRLAALEIEVEQQTESSYAGADLVVLSPGVPADVDLAVAARKRGVKVIGDLELASWFLEGDNIGITGANGKTTTTALTGHILKESGISSQIGGNIGTPPCSLVATSRAGQWNVLELSSFQLETIETFRAKIGSTLNLTPDHLDRHYTLENYSAAKARLFETQQPNDFAVLNADDAITRGYSSQTHGAVRWFSVRDKVERGAWLAHRTLVLDGKPLMEISEIPLRGMHNVENTLAAAIMAQLAGASPEYIRAAVMSFAGVEHRIEFVRERNGIAWYNDSKATNVDATLKALAAFDGGLWVILGGKDKNSDYTPLADLLAQRSRGVLLIGHAAAKIQQQLAGKIQMESCETLDRAIQSADRQARPGDTVLLAPACASFDQFENFEHRGREFKRLVNALG